jgi:hypothetical protein
VKDRVYEKWNLCLINTLNTDWHTKKYGHHGQSTPIYALGHLNTVSGSTCGGRSVGLFHLWTKGHGVAACAHTAT